LKIACGGVSASRLVSIAAAEPGDGGGGMPAWRGANG